MNEQELVQYYVVNKDLGMTAGKIGVQTAHASRLSALRDGQTSMYQEWLSIVMKTIVLEAKESRLRRLIAEVEGAIEVHDIGLTEVPENSLTVVVLPVMTREESKKYLKGIQALKERG